MVEIEQKRLLKPKQILRLTDDGYLCLTVERLLSHLKQIDFVTELCERDRSSDP